MLIELQELWQSGVKKRREKGKSNDKEKEKSPIWKWPTASEHLLGSTNIWTSACLSACVQSWRAAASGTSHCTPGWMTAWMDGWTDEGEWLFTINRRKCRVSELLQLQPCSQLQGHKATKQWNDHQVLHHWCLHIHKVPGFFSLLHPFSTDCKGNTKWWSTLSEASFGSQNVNVLKYSKRKRHYIFPVDNSTSTDRPA